MHTLTCTSTFGNFEWTATVDVSEEQAVALANAGLLQIIQRSPASKAEKVLGNYEKRPSDFVRSSIVFSETNSEILAKHLGETIEVGKGDDKVVIGKPTIVISEHVIGEASQPKFADEKNAIARHIEAKDIAKWAMDTVGYNGGGDLDGENLEFLKAIKAYKLQLIANA